MEYTTKSSTVHQKQEVTTSTEYTKSTNIADGSIQDTLTIYVNTSQVDKSMKEESYMHYNTADSLPLTTPHISDTSLTYGPLINFDDMQPDSMLPEIETGSFDLDPHVTQKENTGSCFTFPPSVTIESTEPDYMSDSADYLHYSFNSLASVPEEFLSSEERLSLINHSLIANKSSLMSDDSFSGGSLSCREESNSNFDLDSLEGATSSADVSNVLANQETTPVSSADDSQSMAATDETVMTPLIDEDPKSTRKDNSMNSVTNQSAFSKPRLGPAPFKVVTDAVICPIRFTPYYQKYPTYAANFNLEDVDHSKQEFAEVEVPEKYETPLCQQQNDETLNMTSATQKTEKPSLPVAPEPSRDSVDVKQEMAVCVNEAVKHAVVESRRLINVMKLCFIDLVKRREMQRLYNEPPPSPDIYATVASSAKKLTKQLMEQKAKELGGDDSLGSIQYTPVFPKHVNKLNGSKTEQFSKNSGGRKNSNPANKFTREESIIDLEIKLQQEREKDLHIQRELARSSLSSPPASNKQGTTTTPAYAPIVVNGTHHNVQNGSSSNLKDVSLHKSAPEEEKTPDTTDGALSPQVVLNALSPWYATESPIERDIRITREREEALKSTRRQQSK